MADLSEENVSVLTALFGQRLDSADASIDDRLYAAKGVAIPPDVDVHAQKVLVNVLLTACLVDGLGAPPVGWRIAKRGTEVVLEVLCWRPVEAKVA